MRRALAVCAVLLAAACARPPVTEQVTIDYSGDDDSIIMTAQTDLGDAESPETRARVESARDAILAGTDAWGVRFARVAPENERDVLDRTHGVLTRATRSIRIPYQDLQRVFSDVNVTVHHDRGDGWRELAFYPGTPARATREQQRELDAELSSWSTDAARYLNAVHELYDYLDTHPQRAKYVFAAVIDEKGPDGADPLVLDEEQPLVDAVNSAMERLADRLDAEEGRAPLLAEQADLVMNPFPSRVIVRLPGEIIGAQGFTQSKPDEVVIEQTDLFGAVKKLENRWISPDPFLAVVRNEGDAESLAAAPRYSEAVVTPSEVGDALKELLARPKTYVVRWRE